MLRNSSSKKSLSCIPSGSYRTHALKNDLDIPANLKKSYELVMQYTSLGKLIQYLQVVIFIKMFA